MKLQEIAATYNWFLGPTLFERSRDLWWFLVDTQRSEAQERSRKSLRFGKSIQKLRSKLAWRRVETILFGGQTSYKKIFTLKLHHRKDLDKGSLWPF